MKRCNIVLLNKNDNERYFREIFRGSHRFFEAFDISPVDCCISLSDNISDLTYEINTLKQDIRVKTLLLATDKNEAVDGLINSTVTFIDLPPVTSVLDLYKMKSLTLYGDNVEFWHHLISHEIHAIEMLEIL